MSSGADIPGWYRRYPPAEDITPAQFEDWVATIFSSVSPTVDDLEVTVHDRIASADGTYDLDATVRYRWAGLDFLVVVEAKKHSNPIKRDVVQVLHAKVQSIGAHKGIVISTAPFQRGAVDWAKAHGIALCQLSTEKSRTRLAISFMRGHHWSAGFPAVKPSPATAGSQVTVRRRQSSR